MARVNPTRRARRQANTQARAEYQPQIAATRRGEGQEVAALRSEEDPLQHGIAVASRRLRHAGLSPLDKALALKQLANRSAQVPESVTSQIASTRENSAGEIGDLQTAESQAAASTLAGLLTAQSEHAQSVHDEIAAEQRGRTGDIAQAEAEKAAGLGSYDHTPSPEEAAEIPKIEAETDQKVHGSGLTPYEELQRHEAKTEDHTTAAHYAKEFLEKGKAGEIEGVDADPKQWTPETWSHLVTAVASSGKVPIAAAEKAVGAIQDHFTPTPVLPWGLGGAIARAANAGAAHASSAPPAGLLRQLAPLASKGY